MVQEEQINTFLLTLTPISRELVRKKLYQFFRVGRKRRVITHIPVMNLPSRELSPTIEPLKLEEQKAVARQIHSSSLTHPEEALLTTLCFYHGLSSLQICQLKLHDIDLEKRTIYLENRPPAYLLAEDLLLLEQVLQNRQNFPSYAKNRSYLFINKQKRLTDEPVTTKYIHRKVQTFTGFTPQHLWISCYAALAAQYGPQYLVEALGLSLSQASRYGKLQEFLLGEEVKQQREEFLELSHRLEQGEKQRSERSRRKKEK